jgi:hypothetical protein
MGLTPYPYQPVTYAYATVGYQSVTSMSTPDFRLQTDNIAPTPCAFSAQCSAVRSRPACDRAGRGKEGEITDAQVVRFGENAAVVVYRMSARREGQPEFNAVVSSTFVRRGSDSQLAFRHQSPTP